MTETKNILLAGVGGQGTITASKILSTGLIEAGYDVKMAEIHGMSQRGGSVTTQVRFGEKVYSPIIGEAQADILISFEVMETLRWLKNLKPDGVVVLNDYKIPSVPILTGAVEYPERIIEEVKSKAKTTVIDAAKIAEELGNIRTMNVVLLGALIKAMNLTEIDWEGVIKKTVKEKFIELNIKALKKGMDQI
ncbi:indolepyruvate oxidoreductase subunit beta [Clostridium sediminicola]|uniref:indolepyruvate oxidoreductase subunit beta n=1 Tax=Clostridium sediminicola TaxID=3114879 RepID=UPI0031F23CF2